MNDRNRSRDKPSEEKKRDTPRRDESSDYSERRRRDYEIYDNVIRDTLPPPPPPKTSEW
jgi:hypothetical protein